MKRKDEILYTGRLLLFGVIPLWKIKHTKREWEQLITLEHKRNRLIEVVFIDDKEEEHYG
ncbi:hypothetical protein [Streptococcus pluranimalium]|uniref:hypothetical protein n=1 Tax=Streptococcus pluranimalium TaxID=82348 RepID=UPI003899D07D